MKTVRVSRHPGCPECARYAARHERLDGLGRVDRELARRCDNTCEIRS